MESLALCIKKYPRIVNSLCADMKSIPVPENSFDFIVANGALSYGDYHLISNEILRVVKPHGSVIFMDSLNHNPTYRTNRFIRSLVGSRTRISTKRI
jgi:ubiquinone/menaquinone biosynthesis C-methylase UbiE